MRETRRRRSAWRTFAKLRSITGLLRYMRRPRGWGNCPAHMDMSRSEFVAVRLFLLSTMLCWMLPGMGSAIESDWPCDLTLTMPAELVDNNVLVFGELHGTKEAPFAFLSAVCERLSLSGDEAVSVGLEYPIAEAESLLDY